MTTTEFKARVSKVVRNLIDTYFSENTAIDKMANATLKVLLDSNMTKLDEVIQMFSDKDGNIDAVTIVNSYANSIGDEGMPFDIRDYVKSDFLRGILPRKSLIINKDDIMKILDEN